MLGSKSNQWESQIKKKQTTHLTPTQRYKGKHLGAGEMGGKWRKKRVRKAIPKAERSLLIAHEWQHCCLFILCFDTCEILFIYSCNETHPASKKEKKKKYSVSTEKGENIGNISRYCLLNYIQTEYISHLTTAISSFELQLRP